VTWLSFPAPAKLNLTLRVVGRRADGYHLLQTIFRFIDWSDEVRIALRDDGVIRRLHELDSVPAADDLTVRAARLLQQASGTRLGADLELAKRLPIGAGLGGGSSDAATVLVALNHLWETGFSRSQLQKLALELGADVPVFVFGQSAVGEGVGEMLTALALPRAWYVVLTPPVSVATARVFSQPDLKRDSKMIKIQGFSAGAAVNDLESVVCRLYPEVARYLAWLRQHGPAHMTGSGGAVFAGCESEQAARAVLAQLPADMSGVVAQGLDRHPLWELAQ
jgi:4-diphosphocytidyl-2-C-methyl-D-erythritol kinase